MVFHQDGGDSVLGVDQVERIFKAVDTIRSLDDYAAVCARTPTTGECNVHGVTKFFNNSVVIFDSQVSTDEDAIRAMSAGTFPDDGTPVVLADIFGNAIRDEKTQLLTSAQSYIVRISLPEDEGGETVSFDFEEKALEAILDLDRKWEAETGTTFRVEVFAERSIPDELERALLADTPLVPFVFLLMVVFTSLVFFKRDKVRSRSRLGFMAVVSVALSILSGFGLMFVCSVPFTSITTILPFVFFGVGKCHVKRLQFLITKEQQSAYA